MGSASGCGGTKISISRYSKSENQNGARPGSRQHLNVRDQADGRHHLVVLQRSRRPRAVPPPRRFRHRLERCAIALDWLRGLLDAETHACFRQNPVQALRMPGAAAPLRRLA
ncbi:MAG: hypothetical protein R3C08_02785 [Hyphomonas sp.]